MEDNKNTTNNNTNDNTTNTPHLPNTNNNTDPDLIKLHQLPEEEQLWFFLDDIVPTDTNDTEIIIIDDGVDDNNIPQFVLGPKSLEIFETIANEPNHAMSYYPNMIKYFQDIIHLYNTIVIPDRNPYWVTHPIQNISPQMLQMLIDIHSGNSKGFLSRKPVPNSIPYRLIYGDNTHKHDFVGIVYMYTK